VEYLPKAPIREALIDIRVGMSPEFHEDSLKKFGKGLEQRFPLAEPLREYSVQFTPTGEPQTLPGSNIISGYRFVSNTEGKTVQAQRGGFTFNKLAPYGRWEDFSAEAKELWLRYVEIVKPKIVHRIAVRYINRIELPPTLKDLRDLSVLFPDLPDLVSKPGVSEYFQRFVVPRNNGIISAVILSLDNPPWSPKPAVILDIDVWSVLQEAPTELSLWGRFEDLRVMKNTIFDASLTEETKALFR
jgi:uncharacterized protein (TIGR04255 family)